MSFLCSSRRLSQRGVSVPVVQGSTERCHQLSRAARSVSTRCLGQCVVFVTRCHIFESNSIQKVHKTKMF